MATLSATPRSLNWEIPQPTGNGRCTRPERWGLKTFLESEPIYGEYIASVEVGERIWYIAEKAVTVSLGDKSSLALSDEYDFSSEEAKGIPRSLDWV